MKLQETQKTFDQLSKRHENEVLRKKRLAFVGISLDNVLQKGAEPSQRASKGSKASSQESNNGECHRPSLDILIVSFFNERSKSLLTPSISL